MTTSAVPGETRGKQRWMRTLLLAAGLALLLTSTTLPAGAETRDEARQQANGFIDTCFNDLGGEPSVSESDDDGITVTCAVGDTLVGCNWVGGGGWEASCWDLGTPDILFEQPDFVPIDWSGWPDLRWIVDDLPADLGEVVVTAPATSASVPQHSASGPGNLDQDQGRDHDTGKGKSKKGKGKKGGKGRK